MARTSAIETTDGVGLDPGTSRGGGGTTGRRARTKPSTASQPREASGEVWQLGLLNMSSGQVHSSGGECHRVTNRRYATGFHRDDFRCD